MSMVGFPLLLIPLAIYNIIVFLMPGVSFAEPLVTLPLTSGAQWPVTLSDVLLALGILMLLLEVIKGARPGAKFLTDHLLSLIVFGGCAGRIPAVAALCELGLFPAHAAGAGGFPVRRRAARQRGVPATVASGRAGGALRPQELPAEVRQEPADFHAVFAAGQRARAPSHRLQPSPSSPAPSSPASPRIQPSLNRPIPRRAVAPASEALFGIDPEAAIAEATPRSGSQPHALSARRSRRGRTSTRMPLIASRSTSPAKRGEAKTRGSDDLRIRLPADDRRRARPVGGLCVRQACAPQPAGLRHLLGLGNQMRDEDRVGRPAVPAPARPPFGERQRHQRRSGRLGVRSGALSDWALFDRWASG